MRKGLAGEMRIEREEEKSSLTTQLSFLFQFTLAALLHGGLLFLTSVCESTTHVMAVLVPTKCDNFNQNFVGDPALTFAAGCHCFLIAAPIFLLLVLKTFQWLLRRS